MGDFADAARKVKRLRGNMEDGFAQATEEGMEQVGSELTRALELNGSVARPYLKDQTDPTHDTREIRSVIRLPHWARYVESGTGPKGTAGYPAPSYPPYNEILEWGRAKPIVPEDGRTIEEATALIAESIAEDGTEPHPFVSPVWDGAFGKERLIARNRAALSAAVRRTF